MKQLTHEALKELLQDREGPCVSVYMAVSRVPQAARENGTRLRGLLHQAEEELQRTATKHRSRELLAKYHAMEKDHWLWNRPMVSLALFAAPGYGRMIPLHRPVGDMVSVADSFHTKPLMRATQFGGHYQVLCISQRSVKLHQGNQDGLEELDVKGVPKNIMEAMRFYSETPQTFNARPEAVDRVGGGSKDSDPDTLRFFRVLDRMVWEHVSRSAALPLILCAVDEYHHLFHEVSHNPYLISRGIRLNPDSISKERLQQEAWKIVEPHYQGLLDKMANDFRVAKSHRQGSDSLRRVAEAAALSRVATLLVDADKQIGGKLDRASGRIQLGSGKNGKHQDVLDDIAEAVMKTGGQVLVVPHQQMPTDRGLAAIYRF